MMVNYYENMRLKIQVENEVIVNDVIKNVLLETKKIKKPLFYEPELFYPLSYENRFLNYQDFVCTQKGGRKGREKGDFY